MADVSGQTATNHTVRERGLLRETVEGVRHLVRADAAFLALLSSLSGRLHVAAATGLSGRLWRQLEYSSDDAFAGAALSERRSFAIPDLVAECANCPACLEAVREDGLVSALGAPFAVGGQPEGILYVANRRPEGFGERDPELLQLFARQASIAIENARLFERAEVERGRLVALLGSSPAGIVVLGVPEGRLLLWNRRAEELAGRPVRPDLPLAELPGYYGLRRRDGRLYRVEDLPVARAFRGEEVTEVEVVIRQPSGGEVVALANAAPIRDGSGRVVNCVVTLQDITSLKRLERLREEFTSVVAHDLREPVAVIHGFADYLRREAQARQASPVVLRGFENILSSARRLNRMIGDLLDVSRIETSRLRLEKQLVEVGGLVREVVERVGEITKGHRVVVEVEDGLAKVEADPSRLEQVLVNLLSNAAKYSAEGREIAVGVGRAGDEVRVSVTDRGMGIAEQELGGLFDRFHRAERATQERVPGLGLGLYIAKGLVEAHGGRIWVESTPGEGSTFTFALPTRRT